MSEDINSGAPKVTVVENAPSSNEGIYTYAGFWERFVAYMIDGFIMIIPILLVTSILSALFLSVLANRQYTSPCDMMSNTSYCMNTSSSSDLLYAIYSKVISLVIGLFVLSIFYIYFALMESSKYQATVGKIVLGLKVTDTNGYRLSFGRALGRNFAKIISSTIFYIGFIMAAFTEKKQALHDIIANTVVVKRVSR